MGWTGYCVSGDHANCPDTRNDQSICDCPCHLKEGCEAVFTFVKQHDEFSTYRRNDGTLVHLAHEADRPFTRFSFEWDRDEMREFWEEEGLWQVTKPIRCNLDYCSEDHTPHSIRRNEFLTFLRTILTEAKLADEIHWCASCDGVEHQDDGRWVQGGDFVCEPCVEDHYYFCDRCDEYSPTTTETMHDTSVCDYCRGNYYLFCDACDGYYADEHSAEHDHNEPEGNGCCDSPAMVFAMRNDGDPPLANDVRVTIGLPAGIIDEEGINRIRQYLYNEGLDRAAYLIHTLGEKWQAKEGNFTKRLGKALYTTHGEKIPPKALSQVGCIARDHSTSVEFAIEVTRDLNLSAEEFAHEDSCWWGSYYTSRCALKSNGGFGLRTFKDYEVTGRAWVMPLKLNEITRLLKPTFETMAPDAFVVFNGYGDLSGYNAARIVSHMAGWTYRKLNFSCTPMFVNGDSGYLIAPEEIATNYTDGSLHLSVDQHSDLFHAEARNAERNTEKELVHV